MANELDEMRDPSLAEGRDVRVIAKQLPVTISGGIKFYDLIWWILPVPIVGGLIWSVMKAKTKSYLQGLQQQLQHDASQIDNYLEQRVQILKNCAKLVDKAIDLDKDTFATIAAYRGGVTPESDAARVECATACEKIGKSINLAFENYPELHAHQELADAIQQNSYLQREITAAREVYNDNVNKWNREIFEWPTKKIVAAKEGYTTRIPFSIDDTTREQARGEFF